MRMKVLSLFLLITLLSPTTISLAEEKGGGAAEMARKLQNPLATIKAIMTDNVIGFNTGTDKGTSYGFQLQPVYAIDLPNKGFTLIPRAVIPIVGLEPGTDTPITGENGNPTPSGSNRAWGLGDTVLQFFFAPHTKAEWKWGVGPQVSIPTHTDNDLRGPDWGAGIAGVVVGYRAGQGNGCAGENVNGLGDVQVGPSAQHQGDGSGHVRGRH